MHRQVAFPVRLNQRLHGILSLEDLKACRANAGISPSARDVMRPIAPRFFVEPNATLDYARELMKRNGIGSLAVVGKNGELVGFLQSGQFKRKKRAKTRQPHRFVFRTRNFSTIIRTELSFSQLEGLAYAGRNRRALCQRTDRSSEVLAAADHRSSGMMARRCHSVADTTNQVFLLLGLRFYKRPASTKHPFGYGKERFFWSFIAAIFIFGVGATYAIYEGIDKLWHPHPPTNLGWAYGVLALSFVLESARLRSRSTRK
jgi:hypothetical protein